jgi:hypothetical protein
MGTSFLEEEDSCQQKPFPPPTLQPYPNVPANNPKTERKTNHAGRLTNKSH